MHWSKMFISAIIIFSCSFDFIELTTGKHFWKVQYPRYMSQKIAKSALLAPLYFTLRFYLKAQACIKTQTFNTELINWSPGM